MDHKVVNAFVFVDAESKGVWVPVGGRQGIRIFELSGSLIKISLFVIIEKVAGDVFRLLILHTTNSNCRTADCDALRDTPCSSCRHE